LLAKIFGLCLSGCRPPDFPKSLKEFQIRFRDQAARGTYLTTCAVARGLSLPVAWAGGGDPQGQSTEFGNLVKIQEAEEQFITDCVVCATRVSDQARWVPSLLQHEQLLGNAPRQAVADVGFASRASERAAHERGVRRVVLRWQRRKGRSRTVRAALKWRTGCEAPISTLTRRHGLRRCRYRGLQGMERWVGLGVIANDLLVLGGAGPPTR